MPVRPNIDQAQAFHQADEGLHLSELRDLDTKIVLASITLARNTSARRNAFDPLVARCRDLDQRQLALGCAGSSDL